MNQSFFLGVDYELYFGTPTGSVNRCMLEPTQRLIGVLEKYDAKLTAFVDSGFLLRLKAYGQTRDYQRVADQLRWMVDRGHDVQLHVHPHWQDSVWKDNNWHIDTTRYRLHDFAPSEIAEIVGQYSRCLEDITGATPIAYRAGGWCLQPFEQISEALFASGVRMDSTVYLHGRSVNTGREFDFSGAPSADFWRFDNDPLQPVKNGRFLELPISTVRVPPTFYWKMAWRKFRPQPKFNAIGDGQPLQNSGAYYARKLTRFENSVASVDGARAGELERAWKCNNRAGRGVLNVMGHPKSVAPASLEALEQFLQTHQSHLSFETMRSFAEKLGLLETPGKIATSNTATSSV